MLAVYVSGHGYGHATRTAEVLRHVRARAPGLQISVRTTVPASLFERAVAAPLSVGSVSVGVGLVQKDALVVDEPGSLAAWQRFSERWDERVAVEARWLRESGARLVLGDIPPLAFAAAAAADVPAVALGNFSWDWIYGHLARRRPQFAEPAEQARVAYGTAALLLRLPFAGDLSAFPRRVDVPLVVRRPRLERHDARRRLGLDARRAVLLTFGGIGLPGLRVSAFAALRDTQVLLTTAGDECGGSLPANLRRLDDTALEAAAVEYPDLVGAVDAVVTKPGYGIVSDCIGARTPLVYTERGDFPEYPIMVAEMGRYLPVAHAANDEVREGRIEDALARVLALPFPEPPRMDGASVAAERLLGF